MEKYFDINVPGYSIKCKIYCDNIRDIKNLVIFSHGFAGHKDTKTVERFAETYLSKVKKAAVLSFDYPCHGKDVRKKLELSECYKYLETVTNYCMENYKPSAVYSYATSFGGYIVLNYISKFGNPFNKIALRCPAIDIYDSMTEKIITKENRMDLEKKGEALIGFDRKIPVTNEFLEEIKNENLLEKDFLDFADDILIIQGDKDEIISKETVKEFADNNVIELVLVTGADHRFVNVDLLKLAHSYIIDFFMTK